MSWIDFMSLDQAERIAKLDSSDITSILTLSSLSQKAEDILRIAHDIKDGNTPTMPEAVLSSEPRPHRIIAPSFVKDKNQYYGIYGLSDKEAEQLEGYLLLDPDDACEKIKTIVTAKLQAKGSQRKVEVIIPDVSSSISTSATTTMIEGDGGAKALSAEVSKNSMVYGRYQFEPESTGLAGLFQYGVHLGDDLFAIGQSKKVVIAAARLCRVKGRFDEIVKPYIWYWTKWSTPLRGAEILEGVWDGKQGVHEPVKPRKDKEDRPQKRKRSIDESELIPEDVD